MKFESISGILATLATAIITKAAELQPPFNGIAYIAGGVLYIIAWWLASKGFEHKHKALHAGE